MKPRGDFKMAVSFSLFTGQYRVICYFTNWAWYRTGTGKYLPENIDPNLCTHVIYGFAVLDYEGLAIKVFDSWADIDNSEHRLIICT